MSPLISTAALDNLVISLFLVGAVTACRIAGERALTRRVETVAARRRRFTIRAVANAVLALSLLGVWIAEIQNLVFSLAAVMVALVIATKELTMCMAGAFLRFGGQLFKVGDRIEIGDLRGEVIDHNLFSTTIMELPPQGHGAAGTGRRLMLPNSVLLAGTVRVGAPARHFAPHRFVLTMEHPVPVAWAFGRLEAAAAEALAADTERAARFHRLAAAKSDMEVEGPGFSVTLGTSDLGKLRFEVMLYCLVGDAMRLERGVSLAFLDEVHERLLAAEPAATAEPEAASEAAPHAADVWTELVRKLRDPRPQQNAA